MAKFLIILLIVLKPNFIQAQSRDSSDLQLTKQLVDSDWLSRWKGENTKWIGGFEVFGYSTVDMKIKFFKGSRFELDVYYNKEFGTFMSIDKESEHKKCITREDGLEISVFVGKWSVKRGTVYLTYTKEMIYDIDEFVHFDYERSMSDSSIKPPLKPKSTCYMKRKEVYTFYDKQLCLEGQSFYCFK